MRNIWILYIFLQHNLDIIRPKTMAISFALLLLITLNGAHGYRVGIVGGREAAPNSRPYMASVQLRGRHFCGGVLVREDFVLTAAHCRAPGQVEVVLGAHSLSANEDTKQSFTVSRQIQHPEYIDGELENDVMLLKLDARANLTSAVQLIPLLQQGPRPSDVCSTAGWGDTGDNNTFPDKLQEVEADILSKGACRRRWRTAAVLITAEMVCATGPVGTQGFCSGDSGGPLVCNGTSAGVVSFSGRLCADPRRPDVYMRSAAYRTWVEEVFSNNPL